MELKSKPGSIEAGQQIYARWLEAGTRLGLAILVASFAVYVLGLVPPHVALQDLPRLWSLPAAQYLPAAAAPSGWGWLQFIQRGDYLNYFGIVLLASITALCYLRLLPLLASREKAFFWIAVLEIAVLAVAASGLLAGTH